MSIVVFPFVYKNLADIMLKTRYGSLGILGYSLRNKIPIVGNQVESEMGAKSGLGRR
jgi:hypothetical protein